MLPMQKLFMTLLGLNLFGCFVFYLASLHHQDSSLSDFSLSTAQDFYTQTEPNPLEELRNKVLEVPLSAQKVSTPQEFFTMPPFADPYSPDQSFTRQTNPFHKLGAYPEEIKIKLPYQDKYEQPLASVNYGIENEDDYCERVDYYNLANTANIFEDLNFFSDFADNTITRHVITKIGEDTQPNVHNYNVTTESSEKQYTLDVTINTFFTHIDDFHRYHKIGKNFLCATQMYNHIPGSQALVKKDAFLKTLNSWVDKHSPRPFCFNGETYFLKTYRLSIQEECDSFFNRIKSKRYQKQLGSEPIQYIIKSTDETGSTDGVYLLDQDTTSWLFSEFNYGIKCGSVNTSLVAETYITNPLLLNMNNKFDFRVYMLIASTNPLIVYSHDGFLKASVSPYDKFSTDREKHLTSTRLANEIFMKAREQSTYNGKTEQQLRDAHILKFEDLQKYLLETGKITDKDWLENSLRPQFKKIMIHLAKMASPFYLKQSNVYGLYELEFMLDDNLNLWFIEANANPELVATNKVQGEIMNNMLRSLFEIEYGLYRSRMKRAFTLITKLRDDNLMGYEPVNYNEYKGEYLKEIRNRFEPEFLMSQLNTFSLVMDESLPGQDAYQNYLDILCVFAH